MKTTLSNLFNAKKKILSMVLALSILISLFPMSDIFAWSPPANVTINKTVSVSYFTNKWGTAMTTGFYYVAGTNEIAYCADQEGTGPGGVGYGLNDGGLGNAAYLSGIQRILQNGYPFNANGLSADDARYATQMAIHWIESYYLGGTNGYDYTIRNDGMNANGHDGSLSFALWLFDQGISGAIVIPSVSLEAPTSWTNVGGVLQSTVQVNQANTQYWQIISLPAGVSSVGGVTFTGNVNLILQLNDPAAYAASSKQISIQGYCNIDTSNIHVFVAGGSWQTMVAVSTQSNGLDPDVGTLADANGTLSLYKQTEWTTGVYSSEAGATFQVYNSASVVVATITTDASGNASVSLPYGTYTIHQVSGPGYTVNASDQAYTVSASSPTATFTNTPFTGQIEVNKTYAAVTGTVVEAGAVFQIFPASSSYAASADYQRDQITTNGSGYAISKSLPYGTYTLVQTASPTGSRINGSSWTFELGVDGATFINGDIDTVNVSNTPTTGKLEISKTTNRGYIIPETGAVFEVYSTAFASYAAASAACRDTLTTDGTGTAITKDLPYGNYWIHQIGMPAGTIAVADSTVTLGATDGATIHRDLVNTVYWGQIEVNKTTSYAGNVKLEAGAQFQIYSTAYASYAAAPTAEKATITTNASGYAISKLMPYGTYTMSQTAAPTGAQQNATVWTFQLGIDGVVYLNNDVDTQNVINIPTFGKLEIAKTSNRGYSVNESGATFEIYCTEYASFAAAPAAYKDTVTTNAAGTAITKDLPYGSYNVHQTVMPAGTIATADITVTIGATNGATVHRDLVNTVYWGRAEITKTTSFGGNVKLEPGATFEIYNTSFASYAAAPVQERDTITTNAAGYAITKSLPYGTYIAHQTGTPIGAQLNTGSWSFILGIDGAVYLNNDIDSVNIADTPNFGKLELSKTTNRGYIIPESGATFEVYSMDYASFAVAPIEHKDTITTSTTGNAITKDLPYGVYSVHQSVAPEGTIAVPDFTVTVAAVHGSVIHRDVENPVYWGQAEINKTTELAGNVKLEAGATFQIYNTAYASYAAAPAVEKDTITTDANGHAITKSLPYGTYTASQTVVPVGTQINSGTWTFVLGIDGTTYVNDDVDTENVVNQPSYGQYELSKTTNRGYSVDEAGATFEIYCTEYSSFAAAPAEYKDTITTDINGDAISKMMPYGDYSVHQSVAPAGTKVVADYTVSLKIAQGAVVHQDLVNQTFWNDIQVLKYKSAPSSTSGVLTPEADATFRIYPSEYSTWGAALAALPADQEIVLTDEITSDMGGIAKTNHQLPYGEYTVEQINTIANLYTFKVDAWQVFIGAVDNQTYTYVRNNEIYEQYLAVIKTDAETGQVIKMAGATFQILAADGKTVLADTNGVSSFVTDANGRIDIKDLALQVGNYFIKETKAPKGYVLNSDLKAFAVSIADHGSSIVTIDYGVDIRGELFADTAQTCQLMVEKKGDVLTSATLIDAVNPDTGARYSDEAGSKLSIYQFGYSLTGKAGAVFEAFVGEKDIGDNVGLLKKFDKDGDGVKETELTAGTSLGQITTVAVLQKDGTTRYIASLAGLPLDSTTGTAQYVVKEVKAPAGDLINPKTLTYDFTFADQTIAQIDQEQAITDIRQKVQITVEKQKEAGIWNKDTKSFDWPLVAAPQILFGLYTAKNVLAADGSVLVPADTLVDVLFTDTKGLGHTSQDLPMENYYAKELNVTPDVVYDSITKYPVTTVPTADQTVPTAIFALSSGKPIINRQIAGTMEIYKYAEDTNLPMSGVVFEVYDLAGNLVDTVTTTTAGTAETRVLPYARYTLVETKTNTGYALSENTSFSIWLMPSIGNLYSTDEMTVVNLKQAEIEVFKTTGDGTTIPMDGVEFGVYAVSDDTLVATIKTDEDGYGSVFVPQGKYYMVELLTWEGYALSTARTNVDAEWTGVYNYRETNSETSVTLNKSDVNTNAGIAGAEITILDSTGKEVSRTLTDQKGETTIKGLPAGTYTFNETVAPTGYVINTTIFTFTIDQYGKVTGQSTIVDNPTSLTIKKTSTVSDNGLQGTQFTVTDAATMQLVNVVWVETLKAYVPTKATVLGAFKGKDELTTLTTGADGTATVLYLPVAEYIITEIKAPDGYNLDSNPTNVNVKTESTGVLGASLTIKNSPILPKTGEMSRNEQKLTGGFLIALSGAAILLFIQKNRKKKDETQA